MKPGTVFMITGGAKGIGAATSALVVALGGRVAVCGRDQAAGRDFCDTLGAAAFPVQLDVRSPEAWERAADQAWATFGCVDVLVNNAGVAISGSAHDLGLDEHRQTVEVNVLGPIYGTHTLVPRFLRQGSGHIVNVGSFAAFSPTAGLASYSASKHALRAFTHSCDFDLTDTPVGLSLVCCGAVETPMLKRLAEDDKASLVFMDAPLAASSVAEAIVRAAEQRPHEILVPPVKGAALRLFGLFPGLLKRTMPAAAKWGSRKRQTRTIPV